MEEARCSLCTTIGAYDFTEYTEQEEVPMSKLRCGHEVHTHCFINHLFMQKVDAECKECNMKFLTDDATTYYRQLHEYQAEEQYDLARVNNENNMNNRIANLWNDNEEFRTDIKAYRKLAGTANKFHKNFRKDLSEVHKKFKQNTLASVELIKEHQKITSTEYKSLDSLKSYRKIGNKLNNTSSALSEKWGATVWQLRRSLNNVEGAPKMGRSLLFYKWRYTPKYLFRIRV